MAEHVPSIALDHTATLTQLAEAVRTSRRPLHVQVADVSITARQKSAAQRRTTRSTRTAQEKYPTVASLAGAAGTVPRPAPWIQVRESAREVHLAAKFGSPHS